MGENMSLGEALALTDRRDGNDNFLNGGGFLWIVVLFLIFGMNGWGGFGAGGAAAQGALTRAEMFDGFNTAEIQRNQGDLMRGQFETQKEIMQNRFDNAQCCCNTQKEILESRYTTQLGFQGQQAQLSQCCCDIKTAIHAEAEATRALINNNTMQELRDNLQAAQLQLGNLSQTQNLINALRPTPVPAYITCSPYQAVTMYGCGASNCCC